MSKAMNVQLFILKAQCHIETQYSAELSGCVFHLLSEVKCNINDKWAVYR